MLNDNCDDDNVIYGFASVVKKLLLLAKTPIKWDWISMKHLKSCHWSVSNKEPIIYFQEFFPIGDIFSLNWPFLVVQRFYRCDNYQQYYC